MHDSPPGCHAQRKLQMEDLVNRFLTLKSGYYMGRYNDRAYAVTIEESDDKRRCNAFLAEEFGGNGRVSFDLYLPNDKVPLLTPCEMRD